MHRSILLVLSACLLAGTAQAADMIVDDGYGKTRHSVAVVHTAPRYVAYAYDVCEDLILTYRAPRDPRHETVRICHPPLPGQ